METKKKNNSLTPFGKAVKKKVIDKGITLSQLAKDAGTTSSYLNLILYGIRPGDKYIYKIADLLDIDIAKYVA